MRTTSLRTGVINARTTQKKLLLMTVMVLLLFATNFAQATREIFFYQLPPMKCINGICITLKELNADINSDGTQTAYFLITFDTKTKNNLFWNSYTKSNIEIAETTKTKLFERNLLDKVELEIYDVINERTEQEIENEEDETGKRTTNTINKYVYTIGKISDVEAKSLQKTKYVVALKVPWTQLTWNLSTIYGKIDPDITGCGTFSSAGYYTLLNDIVYDLNNASTGSYYCFTFTSNYGTTIDLNGKTVTMTNFSNLYSFYAYVFRSNQKLHITNGNIIIRPLGKNISTNEIGVYRFDQSGVTDDYHIISNVNITIENRGYVFRTASTNNNYNVKLVNSTFVGKPRDDQTKCDNLDNCGPYGVFIYSYLNNRNTPYTIENSTIIIQNGTGSPNAILFGWINNIDYVINNSKIIINCFNSTYGNIPSLFSIVDKINTSLVVENSHIEICLPAGFSNYMIRFESNDGNVYTRFYNNTFNLTRFTSSSFMLNIGPHNTSSSNNTIEFFDNKFYTFTKNYTGGTSQLVRLLYYTGGTGSQLFYNGSINRTFIWNISSYDVADVDCDGYADSGPDYPELKIPSIYYNNLLLDYYPVYYNASCQQQQQPYFYTTIESPQNITYNKTSVEINYTLFNNTPVTCYYSFDLGNTKTQLTNCQNTTITHSAEGFYTLRIYLTNDSGTTWNFTEVNYTILTVVDVNLISPSNITYYSLPIVLQYNFTNSTPVSCAYAIDNNPFVDISCQNTTINVVEGFHNLTLRINNSVRTNFSYVNFTYVVPKLNLTLLSPTNTTYYVSDIDLLYSYSHNTNETPKCYYRIDNNQFNEIIDCENITLTSISFGTHLLELVVNNSYTNNSTSVYFTVLNPMPSISLINPQNITYFSLPIPIQYTYFSPTSPYECKYNLNDGNNITLINCQNTTINSISYGTYKLTIYITNEYEENSDYVYFTYRQPNNSVIINSPQNTTYSVQNINLEYTITNETQIVSCEYKLNDDNFVDITNCVNITLSNIQEGANHLQIRIKDVYNYYYYDEIFFTVLLPDNTPPTINIDNPKNKTYTTNIITFTYIVTDDKSAVAQCNYTIAYTNLTVIKNTTNANCSDSFSEILTYNQSYLFNISAIDTADNFAYNSVIFTIKEPSAQGFGGDLIMESLVLLLTGIGMIYIASKKIFGRAFNTIIKYIGLFFIPFAIITLTTLDDDVKTGLTSALILIIVIAIVFEIFASAIIWIAKALNQKEIAHSLHKWFRYEGEE